MKTFVLTICLIINLNFICLGQNNKTYIIRIENVKSEVYKGTFQSINNNELDLINDQGQTVRFTANEIQSIKVWRKGTVLNTALIGAAVGTVLYSALFLSIPRGSFIKPDTESSFLLGALLGIPNGSMYGAIAGLIFKSKLRYRELNLNEFSSIQTKLEPYSSLYIQALNK